MKNGSRIIRPMRWYDPAGRATSHDIAQAFADYLVAGLQKSDQAASSRPRLRASV